MKTEAQKAALVLVIIVAVLVFTANVILDTYLKPSSDMLEKLVPFIKAKEGGLSRDPNDSASAHPAPWPYQGKTGWHTNKGVTYSSFVANASKGGYAPTADNFFQMPDKVWMAILINGYMKPWPLNEISHLPRIQAVIVTWAWGSGNGGAEIYLARFQREKMGIQDSNITKAEIVANFKARINPRNEKEWFDKLCDQRAQDFSRMATFSVHGRGWLNRLSEFRTLFA